MRIDKFLANLKYGSRSDITKAVKKGLVKINKKTITNSHIKFDPNKDLVYFNDELVKYYDELNIMLYKPEGYLSANSDLMHKVVLDLIDGEFYRYDLKIAGRLDLDSEGLLILTKSGKFAHFITSPNNKIKKVYEVIIDEPINNANTLLDGVIIKDGKGNDFKAKALSLEKINDNTYIITDRKSTRLNSSHVRISYAVFCLKKKKKTYYLCSLSLLYTYPVNRNIYTLSLHDALPI